MTCWRILVNPNLLVGVFLRSKYFPNSNLFQVKLGDVPCRLPDGICFGDACRMAYCEVQITALEKHTASIGF
ncbi:hypothetical protein ACFX1Z_025100 [Malus domestica]